MSIENFNVFECCPVDPSHTIWYGLIINILELFRNRVFDPQTRTLFDKRLLFYQWPRGVPRLTFNIGSAKLKRWSMSIYKQIALVLPALFSNLLDDEDFKASAAQEEAVKTEENKMSFSPLPTKSPASRRR